MGIKEVGDVRHLFGSFGNPWTLNGEGEGFDRGPDGGFPGDGHEGEDVCEWFWRGANMEVANPSLDAQVLKYATGRLNISSGVLIDEIEVKGNSPRVAVEGYAFSERRSPKGPKGRGRNCHVEPITAYEKKVKGILRDPTGRGHPGDNTPPKDLTKHFRSQASGGVEALKMGRLLSIMLVHLLEILDGAGVNPPWAVHRQ